MSAFRQSEDVRRRAPRLESRLSRASAGIGVFLAAVLALFGIVLLAFAQIVPAVIVFILAAALGIFCGAALRETLPDDAGVNERYEAKEQPRRET